MMMSDNKIRLPGYLQSVIKERLDLKIKTNKLAEFLRRGKPDSISDKQWELLDEQYNKMKSYYEVLTKRISADMCDICENWAVSNGLQSI